MTVQMHSVCVQLEVLYDMKPTFSSSQIHCNLVMTLILGSKRNARYNETSVIMKCTF